MRAKPMSRHQRGRTGFLAAALLLAGVAASPALAQNQPAKSTTLNPPTPRKSDSSPPVLWNYFVLIIIGGTLIVANLIPSKRGHQD
jgi:hypothetical protein